MTRLRTMMAAAAVALALAPGGASAETLVGSNVDSRLILAFGGTDDWVSAQLPEGYAPVPFPAGPMAGATTLVVLIDRHLARGPDGAPLDPAATRSSAFVALATHPDWDRPHLMVLRQYEIGIEGGAYGVSVPADISRSVALDGPFGAPRVHRESWRLAPAGDGELRVDLAYEAGTPAWGPGEAEPRSAADPGFHRIYRYEQLVDVAMSAALGRQLAGEIGIASTVEALSGFFDGSEELLAVLAIPVYVREVSLP